MRALRHSVRWRFMALRRAMGYAANPVVHGVEVPIGVLPSRSALKHFDGGSYEGKEARFVARYIPAGAQVVELGASLGVISQVILNTRPRSLVSVEAFPELAERAREVVRLNNGGGLPGNWTLLVKAIGYNGTEVRARFKPGDNTSGRVDRPGADGDGEVRILPSCTLAHVVALLSPADGDAWLVCDIEGMEVEVVEHDAEALRRFAGIIIETHDAVGQDGVRLGHGEVLERVARCGFDIIDRHGRVACLVRKR
jgi:FkbM family methyltransferase